LPRSMRQSRWRHGPRERSRCRSLGHFQVEASPTHRLPARMAHFAGHRQDKNVGANGCDFRDVASVCRVAPSTRRKAVPRSGAVPDRRRVGVGPNFQPAGLPLDEAYAEAAFDLVKNLVPASVAACGVRLFSTSCQPRWLTLHSVGTRSGQVLLHARFAAAPRSPCGASIAVEIAVGIAAMRAPLQSLPAVVGRSQYSPSFHRRAYTRPSDTRSIAPATALRACFS
jgi:hypothetical protein